MILILIVFTLCLLGQLLQLLLGLPRIPLQLGDNLVLLLDLLGHLLPVLLPPAADGAPLLADGLGRGVGKREVVFGVLMLRVVGIDVLLALAHEVALREDAGLSDHVRYYFKVENQEWPL